jgi:hypothetical protein
LLAGNGKAQVLWFDFEMTKSGRATGRAGELLVDAFESPL